MNPHFNKESHEIFVILYTIMDRPKRIEKCPIVDAVVEIRFESSINPNAIFGIVFNEFKNHYPNVEALPILQLPEPLRTKDPGLQFKAHYKISGDDNSIQIGPNTLVIGAKMPYQGWETFSKEIFDILHRTFNLNIIKLVTRLGIRYINFFELDIFKYINLDLRINDRKIDLTNTLVRTEIENAGFKSILQIANNAKMTDKSGSLIDVDTFKTYEPAHKFNSNYVDEINQGHLEEKESFFSLLNPEFLNTLNPIY